MPGAKINRRATLDLRAARPHSQPVPAVTIARPAPNATDRAIMRGATLLGRCSRSVSEWCGAGGRRDSWWNVEDAEGRAVRGDFATLADVRAHFAA